MGRDTDAVGTHTCARVASLATGSGSAGERIVASSCGRRGAPNWIGDFLLAGCISVVCVRNNNEGFCGIVSIHETERLAERCIVDAGSVRPSSELFLRRVHKGGNHMVRAVVWKLLDKDKPPTMPAEGVRCDLRRNLMPQCHGSAEERGLGRGSRGRTHEPAGVIVSLSLQKW